MTRGGKRKSIRTAGRLVSGVIYTAAYPRQTEQERAAKQHISCAAREKMNLRLSWQKLEVVLAANFGYADLHCTLTYDDVHLPINRRTGVKALKKFIRQLRETRKAETGEALLYVYVTEGAHGSRRLHHHIVINGSGDDYARILQLWPHGNVDFEPIGKIGYTKLAQYLTKEPLEIGKPYVGQRTWTPSLGMVRPIPDTGWVPDNYTLTPPPGATVLLQETVRNEYGEFTYCKYLLPDPVINWPERYHKPQKAAGCTL